MGPVEPGSIVFFSPIAQNAASDTNALPPEEDRSSRNLVRRTLVVLAGHEDSVSCTGFAI